MTTNRPTSRQIKGHFDALRVTKSHSLTETIDIAPGNFGFGREFAGETQISHPDWTGATSNFYIYLDRDYVLVLNGTSFPTLSTRMAIVIIESGVITEIIDERASINSIEDGYRILYDDSIAKITYGDTVQEAIDNLDAYVHSIIPRLGVNLNKHRDIEIMSGVMNGNIKVTQANWTQALVFRRKKNKVARATYTLSLPDDYVDGTDIVLKMFWSPPTAHPGDINWRFKYKILRVGLDETNAAFLTTNYIKESPGVGYRLIDSGNDLIIPASDIISHSILLIIYIEREGTGVDTYPYHVMLNRLRIEYVGRGIK
jgi:hypothetical protein